MTKDSDTVAAIILCGGQSRRMGAPKAWLPLGHETLLQRTVRVLSSVSRTVIVSAAPGQRLPSLPSDVIIVEDEQPGMGPLQGIACGLAQAAAHGAARAFVAATDMPFLSADLARYMLGKLDTADVAVPVSDERYYPLCAAYRVGAALEVARELLARGERRPRVLFERLRTREVPLTELREAGFEENVLTNVNTPDDYKLVVRAFLGRSGETGPTKARAPGAGSTQGGQER